jgi:hypothetical protein
MHLQLYNCALYEDAVEETVEHLFLLCDFARACWQLIVLTVPQSFGPFQILESFNAQLNVPFFMVVIIIMCWSIWAVRNNLRLSYTSCKEKVFPMNQFMARSDCVIKLIFFHFLLCLLNCLRPLSLEL